jgi:2-oxoacid:acceptor oxidoreductase gamma subunit (pyruvate/2-ketoisovalerate family)
MVVVDPTLLKIPALFSGLKPGGILVVNTSKPFDTQPDKNIGVAGVINATQVALEEIGRDIPNTCILGAFAATTQWLKLESIITSLKEYFSGDILARNIRSTERGYSEVKILRWQ